MRCVDVVLDEANGCLVPISVKRTVCPARRAPTLSGGCIDVSKQALQYKILVIMDNCLHTTRARMYFKQRSNYRFKASYFHSAGISHFDFLLSDGGAALILFRDFGAEIDVRDFDCVFLSPETFLGIKSFHIPFLYLL